MVTVPSMTCASSNKDKPLSVTSHSSIRSCQWTCCWHYSIFKPTSFITWASCDVIWQRSLFQLLHAIWIGTVIFLVQILNAYYELTMIISLLPYTIWNTNNHIQTVITHDSLFSRKFSVSFKPTHFCSMLLHKHFGRADKKLSNPHSGHSCGII